MKIFTLILLLAAPIYGGNAIADEASDREALRALDQSYALEWLEGDAEGVLALFTDDATLVPHHGDAPIVGKEAIADFWFNPDYSPTVVPEWSREPAEILVMGDVGVVRGRARLVWEYEGTRTTIPEGNYVMIAVRTGDGWRIRMLTWNDDPRKWLQEAIEDNEVGRSPYAAAEAFLALIDQGNYRESWSQSSAWLRGTIDADQWAEHAGSFRKALGAVAHRELESIETQDSLEEMPAGNYAFLYFNTTLANDGSATEMVGLIQESDSSWRVIGYQTD